MCGTETPIIHHQYCSVCLLKQSACNIYEASLVADIKSCQRKDPALPKNPQRTLPLCPPQENRSPVFWARGSGHWEGPAPVHSLGDEPTIPAFSFNSFVSSAGVSSALQKEMKSQNIRAGGSLRGYLLQSFHFTGEERPNEAAKSHLAACGRATLEPKSHDCHFLLLHRMEDW